jgi:hypothetical protein
MASLHDPETAGVPAPIMDHGQGGNSVNDEHHPAASNPAAPNTPRAVRNPEHPAPVASAPLSPSANVTTRPGADMSPAEVTRPLPVVSASAADGLSPALARYRRLIRRPAGYPWPVLLGFRPDPTLIECNLLPTRVGWTRVRWEPADMAAARAHRAAIDVDRRKKARELAPRVASLRQALAPVLGLQPIEVKLAVPVEYADRTAGVEVDEDPEPDETGQVPEPEPGALAPVVLTLPNTFPPAMKQAVLSLISDRLQGEWSVRWRMDVHPHRAEFVRKLVKPRPPQFVDWELSPDPYTIFIGRSGRGKVYVKTETETPHWGVSAGTGGGKTTTLLLPAIHYRAHGGLVDIIDMKQESFDKSVRGVSGFRVHTDTISAVMAMAEFLLSAMAVTNAVKRGFPADEVPSRVMLIDEFGSFVQFVKIWWNTVLEKKGEPPVYAWFHVGLMQGRTKNHRFVVGTHDFSRETFHGTGPRDLLGNKILIGPISNPKWITTFGHDFKRVRHQARKTGRAVMGITGTQPEEIQIAYAGADDDVRSLVSEFDPAPEWFDRGEMAPWISEDDILIANEAVNISPFLPGGEYVRDRAVPASQGLSLPPGLRGELETGLRLVLTPEQEREQENMQLVGLREALEKGLLMHMIREANYRNPSDTPDALIEKVLYILRKARKEDPAFPEARGQRGQEKLYLVGELRTWEENRPNRMDEDTLKAVGED